MGGTLRRLKDQGHHVSVAYMTTGSNAVHDHEAEKYLYFVKDFLKFNANLWELSKKSDQFKECTTELMKILEEAEDNIERKRKEDEALLDGDTVRSIKSLIRSSEAKIAVHCSGITPKDVYSLELPFYTHHQKRKDISEEDVKIVRDLLKIVEPTYIYAAGTKYII